MTKTEFWELINEFNLDIYNRPNGLGVISDSMTPHCYWQKDGQWFFYYYTNGQDRNEGVSAVSEQDVYLQMFNDVIWQLKHRHMNDIAKELEDKWNRIQAREELDIQPTDTFEFGVNILYKNHYYFWIEQNNDGEVLRVEISESDYNRMKNEILATRTKLGITWLTELCQKCNRPYIRITTVIQHIMYALDFTEDDAKLIANNIAKNNDILKQYVQYINDPESLDSLPDADIIRNLMNDFGMYSCTAFNYLVYQQTHPEEADINLQKGRALYLDTNKYLNSFYNNCACNAPNNTCTQISQINEKVWKDCLSLIKLLEHDECFDSWDYQEYATLAYVLQKLSADKHYEKTLQKFTKYATNNTNKLAKEVIKLAFKFTKQDSTFDEAEIEDLKDDLKYAKIVAVAKGLRSFEFIPEEHAPNWFWNAFSKEMKNKISIRNDKIWTFMAREIKDENTCRIAFEQIKTRDVFMNDFYFCITNGHFKENYTVSTTMTLKRALRPGESSEKKFTAKIINEQYHCSVSESYWYLTMLSYDDTCDAALKLLESGRGIPQNCVL